MADYTEHLTSVGQVNVKVAQIITGEGRVFDITAIAGDITLYEDLFSNTMSGYILIQDAVDMINNLPLLGEEQFKIELNTPTLQDTISKTFYIYKLHQRMVSGRSQIYKLEFCSKELIYSMNSKVSKFFAGDISDNVVSIFQDSKYLASESKIYIDKTNNEYDFIATYWSPLETINWLAARALNEDNVPNYLFYETNQSFEFVSIDTLLKAEPIREYIYSDADRNTVFGALGDKEGKYSIVESVENEVTFDYLRNVAAGMYASKLYTYDMTSKTIFGNTFDYIDDFGKSTHLGDIPRKSENLPRKRLASLHFIPKNNYRTSEFKPQGYEEFFLQRNSLLEQMSAFKQVIKVPGRTDIKVGNVIKFTTLEIRKILAEELDTDAAISEYFSGKYLITAIRHQIVNGDHFMYMEIVSDAFSKAPGGK